MDDKEKGAEQKGEFGEQISQLQNLVEQMKEGFIQAMGELSLVQDGDRVLQKKVDDNKQEVDQKMEELTESVNQIREDLSAVLKEVQKSNQAIERLAEQFESLRGEHRRMRRRLKQTEQNLENQRQNDCRPSMAQSAKSAGDTNSNSNNHKTPLDNELLRRRKSTPGAYFNGREGRERRGVAQEMETPMSPIIQSFMDSLPDPNDLNNNVGPPAIFISDEGNSSRQYEFSAQNGDLTYSSGNDVEEPEQTSKALSSNQRVSFSNVDQSLDSNNSTEGQRLRLAEEFLLSERKYVGQLNALLESILLPLVTESLIHPSDISIIFPQCLTKMFDRHCCLLCALETRLSDAKWQGMHGDIFAKFAGVESANFLAQYGSYISSFPESLSLLSHHTRLSTKLTNFLKKQLADIEDEQADLLGYLLAPIQRIPAYVLHLKTLLEFTDTDHPDHFHIESCLTHLGNFLATMNPAIEQAVEAARRHKLYLSERSRSLVSTYSPHVLMSSQSSSLTKDSGVQSMEDGSPYNRYSHHWSNQDNVQGALHEDMNGFHGAWTGSPTRQRKAPNHGHTLPNGYRRNRRASLPVLSFFENERVGNRGTQSSPRTSKQHRGSTGRRGSYDQRMLSETYPAPTRHSPMSGDIPGMTYIPEQASDDVEPAYGSQDPNRHRSSRSQNNLTEIPRYGTYRENDVTGEIGYEPSSPSSALPRARQTGANQPQRSPRRRRHKDSPRSSSSSRTSTPREDYYPDNTESKIVFEESDLHHHQRQQQRHRQRSASSSTRHLTVPDLGSEEKAGSTQQLQHVGKSENRRRAHSVSHLNRVRTPELSKPGILKDVWNESKPVNGSAEKIPMPRANEKTNSNTSPRDHPAASSRSGKKSNFLTGSLKNIFFGKSTVYGRKRGSHVVELDEASSQSVTSSTTEPATAQMKADTYQDENGQPCSNV